MRYAICGSKVQNHGKFKYQQPKAVCVVWHNSKKNKPEFVIMSEENEYENEASFLSSHCRKRLYLTQPSQMAMWHTGYSGAKWEKK